jgi:hypothetical protein
MSAFFVLYPENNVLCLFCRITCGCKFKQHMAACSQAVNSFVECVILSLTVRTFAAAKVLPNKSRH